METQDLKPPKPLIEEHQVPEHIHNIQLNRLQKEKFVQGQMVLLENLHLPDGRIVDGKVKLIKDDKGELQVQIFEKKAVLELPDNILSHKLTAKEKEDLLAEKIVPIKTASGQNLFLLIDKDLNRIMVNTERDLSMISEIGGYKLNDRDKLAWINGEKLQTKIFYDEKTGAYFAASIRMTEGGKGVEYHNYKSLKDVSPDQIKEMVKKFNDGPDMVNTLSSATNSIKTDKAPDSNVIQVNSKETTKEVNTTHDNDRRFVEYTNNKDFEGLKRLAQEGYKPEKDLIDRTANQLNLSTEEKKQVMSAIGNETQKWVPVIKEKDNVILELNKRPYKVLELSENGTKALLVDSQNKKIGVSVEHIRLMSKQEKGLYVGSTKKVSQENSIQI